MALSNMASVMQMLELDLSTIFFCFLFFLFYSFSRPFTNNSEIRYQLPTYGYLSTAFVVWITSSVSYHFMTFGIPGGSVDLRGPMSIFFPVFIGSLATLMSIHFSFASLSWTLTSILHLLKKLRHKSIHVSKKFAMLGNTQALSPIEQEGKIKAILHKKLIVLSYALVGPTSSAVQLLLIFFVQILPPIQTGLRIFRGIVPRVDQKPGRLWMYAQISFLISILCSFAYSRCGNSTRTLNQASASSFNLPTAICDYYLSPIDSNNFNPFWLAFGKIADPNKTLGDELEHSFFSPVFVLWATVMSIAITHSVFDFSPSGSASLHKRVKTDLDSSKFSKFCKSEPNFLPMSPWFTLALWETAVQLLVSLKLFLGRFDMRIMLATLAQTQHKLGSRDPGVDRRWSDKEELWFDFMADTGDGGNPTYAIARSLAQPQLLLHIPDSTRRLVRQYSGGNAAEKKKEKNSRKGSNLSTDANKPKPTDVADFHILPRADLLILGGDLAYPSPTRYNYEQRLLRPFLDAFSQPRSVVSPLDLQNCPIIYSIPGNHDWFDGLENFMDYFCHRDWFGGWHAPQKQSYFALELPHGWWVFGLDLALANDIDAVQYAFFKHVSDQLMKPNHRVILITHEPTWVIDWYNGCVTVKPSAVKLHKLMIEHIKGRVSMRLAGDLHHYMRYEPQESLDEPSLVTSGGGGAFLHPTHTFEGPLFVKKVNSGGPYGTFPQTAQPKHVSFDTNPKEEASPSVFTPWESILQEESPKNRTIETYSLKSAFPTPNKSYSLGMDNLFRFRKHNWRFDFVGALLYFLLVISFLPRCHNKCSSPLQTIDDAVCTASPTTIDSIKKMVMEIIEDTPIVMLQTVSNPRISAVTVLGIWIACVVSVHPRLGFRGQFIIGTIHSFSYWISATILALCLESLFEAASAYGILGGEGMFALYRWYTDFQERWFPDVAPLRSFLETYSLGFYPACLKYLMTAFDLPDLVVLLRNQQCFENNLGFWDAVIFYFGWFVLFLPFSVASSSTVLGTYLYFSVNWLHTHWDEGFSSLRIPDYKSFLRFHITRSGELEVFSIGIENVPQSWVIDSQWLQEEEANPRGLSWMRSYPSWWKANPRDYSRKSVKPLQVSKQDQNDQERKDAKRQLLRTQSLHDLRTQDFPTMDSYQTWNCSVGSIRSPRVHQSISTENKGDLTKSALNPKKSTMRRNTQLRLSHATDNLNPFILSTDDPGACGCVSLVDYFVLTAPPK